MSKHLEQLFDDPQISLRIQERMPKMFQLAELESSRAGKIGMEVGTARERIVTALLIYKFGEENVNTDLPIAEPEADALLYGEKISIKTKTGGLPGIKLAWTVDAQAARQFSNNYFPEIDMLLVQIIWGLTGAFFYIPKEAQQKIHKELGKEGYVKLPKEGTNPRGVELSTRAAELIANHPLTKRININWIRGEVSHDVYDRWVELWRE